jgi:uncharacterized OsmC-like protein
MYASRKGWDLKQVSVDLKEEKASGQTKITKAIQVRGNLDPQQLSMLKTVAEKCPINKILLSDIQMESTLNLIA